MTLIRALTPLCFVTLLVLAPIGAEARGARPHDGGSLALSDLPTNLRQSVERSRYEIVADGHEPGSFRAKNPGQGFAVTFRAEGVEVLPAGADAAWEMHLSGYGRGDQRVPAARPEMVVDGSRIEYRRGGVTEWYVNDARGIEQGFTIHERPAGRGDLFVDLGVRGGLAAKPAGSGLTFEGAAARLGYTKLHAFDANGKSLAARMEIVPAGAGQVVRLSVEDQGAAYPVLVDPLLTNERRLNASPARPLDGVGYSVSISGDTAVVGAPWHDSFIEGFENSGAAFVYQRDEGGPDNWGQVTRLTASDQAPGTFFGLSVSISGDTTVIGAPSADGAGIDAGAVYVFERDTNRNWGQVAALTTDQYDFLGLSVSISGNTVVAGAPGAATVFVYERDAGGLDNWGQIAQLEAADHQLGDRFAFSVSIDVDTVVVGAEHQDHFEPFLDMAGAAYVFERDANDNWDEVAKLTASDAAQSDFFGFSVAISGDSVVIGAPQDGEAIRHKFGGAYVFERDAGGPDNWGEVRKLAASDAAKGDRFGISASISGDWAVVGARWDDDDGNPDGAVYVYQRDADGPGSWGAAGKLAASDATGGAYFGRSVSITGGAAIAGAPGRDHTVVELPNNREGWSYVYRATCGDGVTGFAEECDDGNLDDGDCCSSTCTFEVLGTLCDDGNLCTAMSMCDGAGVCTYGSRSDSCQNAFGSASLLIKETKEGYEKVVAKLKNGWALVQTDFGNPFDEQSPSGARGTAYSVCIFDDGDTLVGQLDVDRPGDTCGKRECWSDRGFGWQYKDRDGASSGVSQLKLLGAPSGKSQIQVKAANNAKKGQLALPTGIAAGLTTATSVTLQVVSSDAQCFEATLDQVKKQDTGFFKAIKK